MIFKRKQTSSTKGKCVIQDWVISEGLSFKQQTVLLSAIRGCDGKSKEDPSKYLSKYIRSIVLHNAATEDTKFMRTSLEAICKFIEDIDQYPIHFVTHEMHAFEIIGYFHPDEQIREQCFQIYSAMVSALHLNIESKDQNIERLVDGIESFSSDYHTRNIIIEEPKPVVPKTESRRSGY